MRIFALHVDRALVLPLPVPGSAREEEPWAVVSGANPMAQEADGGGSRGAVADLPSPGTVVGEASAPRRVLWSGTLAEELFERDPRTWGPRGLEEFRRLCDRLGPEMDRTGGRILFRPHARHVLCDVQRCRVFLSEWSGGPFGLLLDPAALLEPAMLSTAQDHLERAFQALAGAADGVLVTGVERVADAGAAADDETNRSPLRPVPVHQGVLEVGLLGRLIRAHVRHETPLVLLDREIGAQLAALGMAH